MKKRGFYEILCNVTKNKIAPLFNAIASIGASALFLLKRLGKIQDEGATKTQG